MSESHHGKPPSLMRRWNCHASSAQDYLDQVCGSDVALRQRIESLLKAGESSRN